MQEYFFLKLRLKKGPKMILSLFWWQGYKGCNKRGTKIKWRLSPLRNYPAQSFAGREKRGGGAICTRINGTVAGTIQECGDLEETQEILAFLNVLSLFFLSLSLSSSFLYTILFFVLIKLSLMYQFSLL